MTTSFDPYHKWLGIPPKDQPPHHYRLLGVELFEPDADVIDNAAEQRMAHIRSFQTGARATESQRLLNQLAAARACLLQPQQRVAYDARLRESLTPVVAEVRENGAFQITQTPATGSADSGGATPLRYARKKKKPLWEGAKIIGGGLGGIALGYLVVAFIKPDFDPLGIFGKRKPPSGITSVVPENHELGTTPPIVPANPPPVTQPVKPATDTKKSPSSGTRPSGGPSSKLVQEVAVVMTTSHSSAARVIGNEEGFVVAAGTCGYFLGGSESFRISPDTKGEWFVRAGGVQTIDAWAAGIRSTYRSQFETEVEWKKDGPATIRLIHHLDGFAVLSGANGCFLDNLHEARVYLADDGYWTLTGRTNFDSRAIARVYRFRRSQGFRATVTETEWRPGKARKQLLHKDEGLCFISSIGGAFRGGGEGISLGVADDGYWYLEGKSAQNTTVCRAISLKFESDGKANISPEIVGPSGLNPSPEVKPKPPIKIQPRPATTELAAASAKLADPLSERNAAKLAELAERSSNPAEQYVLLQAVREAAIAAADPPATMVAVQQMLDHFQLDALDEKATALRGLQKTCQTAAQGRALAEAAIEFCDVAVLEKRIELSGEMALLALTAARKTGDEALSRRATLKLVPGKKVPAAAEAK